MQLIVMRWGQWHLKWSSMKPNHVICEQLASSRHYRYIFMEMRQCSGLACDLVGEVKPFAAEATPTQAEHLVGARRTTRKSAQNKLVGA